MGDNKIEFIKTMVFENGVWVSTKTVNSSTGNAEGTSNQSTQEDIKYRKMPIQYYFKDDVTSTIIVSWLLDPSLEEEIFFHGVNSEKMMVISPAFVQQAS